MKKKPKKKQNKKKNPKKTKKIEKEKSKKNQKKRKIEKRKREKEFVFSSSGQNMRLLSLPIPDSQQYVKRGSCRRLILSGLLCLFSFSASGPFVTRFEFRPRTLSFFYFIESLSRVALVCFFSFSYLFTLNVVFVSY